MALHENYHSALTMSWHELGVVCCLCLLIPNFGETYGVVQSKKFTRTLSNARIKSDLLLRSLRTKSGLHCADTCSRSDNCMSYYTTSSDDYTDSWIVCFLSYVPTSSAQFQWEVSTGTAVYSGKARATNMLYVIVHFIKVNSMVF